LPIASWDNPADRFAKWNSGTDPNRDEPVRTKGRSRSKWSIGEAERVMERMLAAANRPPADLWLPEDEKSLRSYIDSQMRKIGPISKGAQCSWNDQQGRYVTVGRVGMIVLVDDDGKEIRNERGERCFERLSEPARTRKSPCFMSQLTPEETASRVDLLLKIGDSEPVSIESLLTV
jgi:hypothetical protein